MMHWKQRCLDTNVKQWVVFDETSAKKERNNFTRLFAK